ncbi:OmpA family protein [Pseudooceanicola sp.]|uniref:OmpA family protein n=1 Tax=Pseudooceanicola sp. TaxID=1914328 RepID=UPI0026052897|nr:OmpA family protein [Pseudooceanicola sp.]MDF1855385.1 OmpA family protein [Pseudooceanicola sp.]
MTLIKTKFTALGASALLLLGACAETGDGYDNTRQSAAIGGLLGAATGAIIGQDVKGAAIGGVVGGIAGAAYGGYLDQQERELRGSLGNDVSVVNTGDRLVVTMPNDILFATDSATLRGDQTADLRTVAQSLNKYPDTTVQVIGHTDNTGDANYNQRLSNRRADSAADVLISSGVRSSRIQAFGRGEDQPRTTNQTSAGRAQNRRVEIVILPNA